MLIKCACHASDPYECWGMRYEIRSHRKFEIEEDGGPCQCPCHDEWWEEMEDEMAFNGDPDHG